jgi:putative glycosyltransferase
LNVPISIVTTMYKSAPHLEEFVTRCKGLMGPHDELILVDDGSPDTSLAIALRHASEDPRVVVVQLARNFGHHPAILTGLAQARGERIFFVDCDLEERPELLTDFTGIMDGAQADVVFGIHEHQGLSTSRRLTSQAFWRLFNWASDVDMPLNICNVRLMSRRYVEALLSMPERNIFLGGMFHWVGFKQLAVPIERRVRQTASTYSAAARVALAIRSIISFSTVPLQFMFWVGIAISSLSVSIAFYYAVLKLLDPDIQLGFTTLIISIWFLSGAVIACLGVIGIYLAYMYTEIKQRPRTIIQQITRAGQS